MASFCRGLLLGAALITLTVGGGLAQPLKSPGKEVLNLAAEAEAGKDVAKGITGLKKQFRTVRAAMNLYNARRHGGIGFGPKGRAIERRLVDLDEDGLTAEELKKESAELTRVAHINQIMAEIFRGFAPEKPFLGRGKKEWERDVDALKAGSQGLLKALKDNDPKAVQAAARRINKACDSCHDGTR